MCYKQHVLRKPDDTYDTYIHMYTHIVIHKSFENMHKTTHVLFKHNISRPNFNCRGVSKLFVLVCHHLLPHHACLTNIQGNVPLSLQNLPKPTRTLKSAGKPKILEIMLLRKNKHVHEYFSTHKNM